MTTLSFRKVAPGYYQAEAFACTFTVLRTGERKTYRASVIRNRDGHRVNFDEFHTLAAAKESLEREGAAIAPELPLPGADR